MNNAVKDLFAGGFLVAVGAVYGKMSAQLSLGTAHKMGPGYFPLALSCILTLLGIAIVVRVLLARDSTAIGKIAWRATFVITLAVVLFAVLLTVLGMLPAVFLTAMISCFATDQIKLRSAIVISGGIAAFCTLVFCYGIKLPVPVFGSLFKL
jgi:hypothetical protein